MAGIGGNANNITVDFNNSNYATYRILVNGFTSNRVRLIAGKDVRSVIDVEHNVTKGSNTTVCPDVFTCDTNAYILAASGNPYYTKKLTCKLYYCKVWQSGTLLHDLIPVRVGQVGYMYDRVSGELFGNAGTGAFTLGNDKNT
jgi:hypothetical protein